jgi:hypothetical protein
MNLNSFFLTLFWSGLILIAAIVNNIPRLEKEDSDGMSDTNTPIEYITSDENAWSISVGEVITIPLVVRTYGGKQVERLINVSADNENIKILKLDVSDVTKELNVKGIIAGRTVVRLITHDKTSYECTLYISVNKNIKVFWKDKTETNETFNDEKTYNFFMATNKQDIIDVELISNDEKDIGI